MSIPTTLSVLLFSVLPLLALPHSIGELIKQHPPTKDFDHTAEMLSISERMLEGIPEGSIKAHVTDIPNQTFKKALTLDIKKPGSSPWAVRIKFHQKHAWKIGETGMIAFQCRSLSTQNPYGASSMLIQYRPEWKDWRGHLQRDLFLTKNWKLIMFPFKVTLDPKDSTSCVIQFFFGGVAPQTIQIADLHVFSYGQNTKLADLPQSKTYYPGIEPDAEWRKKAHARIEKIRTADLTLTIKDAKGNPIPNAQVHLTLKRHKFGFGAAVRSEEMAGKATTQKRQDAYAKILSRTCSKITPTNAMKWRLYPAMKDNLEELLKWCKKENMTVRGHVLIWPGFARLPDDMKLYKTNPKAFRKALTDHIKEYTSLYPEAFSEWDVMNEPYTEHEFMDLLGKEVVLEWFRTAHNPKYLSYINDYGILTGNNAEHVQNYHQWIDYIVKNNAPLDGIGFQGHYKAPMPPEEILARIDTFAKYGKKMQITEFDFDYPDPALQAQFFEDFLTLIYSHPLMSAHINWIFLADNFRPNAALYRRDFTPTPMGKVWEKLLTQTWHTEKTLTTHPNGTLTLHGYKGIYQITLTHKGKTQTSTIKLFDNTQQTLTFQ